MAATHEDSVKIHRATEYQTDGRFYNDLYCAVSGRSNTAGMVSTDMWKVNCKRCLAKLATDK